MKLMAILAAVLLGFTDWLLFIAAGTGSFFWLWSQGITPDGAFLAALMIALLALKSCSVRFFGRPRSLRDICLGRLSRITEAAGWSGK